MRRVLLIAGLGALLSVTGAQAGSRCSNERQTLRSAATALRSDVNALASVYRQDAALARQQTRTDIIAFHLRFERADKQAVQTRVEYWLAANCSDPEHQHGESCSNHEDRLANVTAAIQRINDELEELSNQDAALQVLRDVLAAERAVLEAQQQVDSQAVSDAKAALAACLAA